MPSFRYQIEQQDIGTDARGKWYGDGWAGRPNPVCSEDNLYYGRWIRQRPTEEKILETLSTLGLSVSHFWLVISRTSDFEREALKDAFEVS